MGAGPVIGDAIIMQVDLLERLLARVLLWSAGLMGTHPDFDI